MSNSSTYTINELAERAQVSRRTIRYYVQRGLLAPPEGKGRGSHYTGRHLQHLLYIRDQQLKGISLEDIDPTLSDSIHQEKPSMSAFFALSPSSTDRDRTSEHLHTFDEQKHSTLIMEPWMHIPLHPHLHIHLKQGEFTPQQLHQLSCVLQDFIQTHLGEKP